MIPYGFLNNGRSYMPTKERLNAAYLLQVLETRMKRASTFDEVMEIQQEIFDVKNSLLPTELKEKLL